MGILTIIPLFLFEFPKTLSFIYFSMDISRCFFQNVQCAEFTLREILTCGPPLTDLMSMNLKNLHISIASQALFQDLQQTNMYTVFLQIYTFQ